MIAILIYLFAGILVLLVGIKWRRSPEMYSAFIRSINEIRGIKSEITPATLAWGRWISVGFIIVGTVLLIFTIFGLFLILFRVSL